MAANSYYNAYSPPSHEQQQHLLAYPSPMSDQFSQPSTPLKPLHLVSQTNYHYGQSNFGDHDNLQYALQEDAQLKTRIRRFRVISRVLSFVISIGVLTPITMTLVKFLQTQNIYRTVTRPDGTTVSRTAWAHDSKVWPTYAYFGVAAISTILNFATIFSYKFGVRRANTVSHVSSAFSWVVMLSNLVVWVVAAAMYRSEKDKGGKSNDLWGWTCSSGAQAIQKDFLGDVDFDQYCKVQGASWVVGLAEVVASFLTVVIYVFVFMRAESKRKVKRLSTIGLAH